MTNIGTVIVYSSYMIAYWWTLGSTRTGPLWCECCPGFVLHWQSSIIFTTFIISVLSMHWSFRVLKATITGEQTAQWKEPPSSPLEGDVSHFPKQTLFWSSNVSQFSWKILCEIENTVFANSLKIDIYKTTHYKILKLILEIHNNPYLRETERSTLFLTDLDVPNWQNVSEVWFSSKHELIPESFRVCRGWPVS